MTPNGARARERLLDMLEKFDRYLVKTETGERWTFVFSTGEGLAFRDAAALGLTKKHFASRKDIEFGYWRAVARSSGAALQTNRVVFFSRPRLFAVSAIHALVQKLENEFWGQFQDQRDGRSADSIAYDGQFFARHQIAETLDGVRLFGVDRALLALRRVILAGIEYHCVVVAGLGTLGTACLTKILCDPVMAYELRQQAERIITDASGCDPELGFEVLVRVAVPDRASLNELPNAFERSAQSDSTAGRGFSFEIDAIALARDAGGVKTWLAPRHSTSRLRLVQAGNKGEARIGSSWKRSLSPSQFKLLSLLNGVRQGIPAGELRAEMGYADDAAGYHGFQVLLGGLKKRLKGKDRGVNVRAWIEYDDRIYTLHVRD